MKTRYKWTVEDYHQLVESLLEGKPVELLEGELIEMSPEGVPYSFTNRTVADYLRTLLQDKAFVSEAHPVTLDNSEPEPDIARQPVVIHAANRIAFVRFIRARVRCGELCAFLALKGLSRSRSFVYKDIYKQHHPYPQDIYWLVEISNSTLEKDLKEKIITYARNGISEAARCCVQVAFKRRSGAFAPAVVDLPHKKVWVFTKPNLQGYSQTREFTSGNIIPSSFPNIAIAINNLLLY